ncbi:uncharacterized protein [Cicer arietinum]|uniref:uncharacterized protein n=1 Tax=Cicer arietinum TaxID=3827 RepID=UPI003CC59331
MKVEEGEDFKELIKDAYLQGKHGMSRVEVPASRNIIDSTDKFITDQVFPSRESVFEWAKTIGRENGILIVIIRSDKATGKRGRKEKLILGCERGGRYKSKSTVTCSHKENCPFTLRCIPLSVGEGWKISVRCGTHNHDLLDTVTGHSYLGRLNEEERKFVNDMTKYKLAPRFILNALKETKENNSWITMCL